MIFIFDLDYTLLDTKKFKKSLAKAAGLSYNKWEDCNRKYFFSKQVNFNLRSCISNLIKEKLISADKKNLVNERSLEVLDKIDECLFPSVESVLSELRSRGHQLILVTFGNRSWQKLKVGNLSIRGYFHKVYYFDQTKNLNFLNNVRERVFLVNDNAAECVELKKRYKKLEIFLINGPYAKNCRHIFEIKNLRLLKKAIKGTI